MVIGMEFLGARALGAVEAGLAFFLRDAGAFVTLMVCEVGGAASVLRGRPRFFFSGEIGAWTSCSSAGACCKASSSGSSTPSSETGLALGLPRLALGLLLSSGSEGWIPSSSSGNGPRLSACGFSRGGLALVRPRLAVGLLLSSILVAN